MKISYNIIKNYLPYLDDADKVAQDLVMHTAEVEEIHSQKKAFENIVLWQIKIIEKHPDADSLSVCMVDVWEKENIQIVCGWSNLKVWQKVAVAKLWASVLWHGEGEPVVMKKTAIRWVESYGMICAADEIGVLDLYPMASEKEIVDLSDLNAEIWTNLADALWKNDEVLEVDNKAINHRPDLFSYIWTLRELAVINNKKLDLDYKEIDLENYSKLDVKNMIPEVVSRYMFTKISWLENGESNAEIKNIIEAAGHTPKNMLVDVSNYSLYFYWQPAHIFDADKISWWVEIRYAKDWEKIVALDDNEYELTSQDMVISDSEKVLAIAWIIGWKSSAVDENTKNIFIETGCFDQAVLRMTWKRLWVRTDSLNVFEKDLLPEMCFRGQGLIISELQKVNPNLKIEWTFDSYKKTQVVVTQEFDLDFYSNLIGYKFEEKEAKNILENLWIIFSWNKMTIPFWRKELTTKADIAEELARIIGYDNIEATIPRINLWAIIQDKSYKIKKDASQFFADRGFFDVYNYSFVSKELLDLLKMDINNCVELKNSLTLDATHMRNSLIPNLMKWLQDNIKDRKDIKLVELEKVFIQNGDEIEEDYYLSWVITSDKEVVYYEIQSIITDFLQTIFVDNFMYQKPKNLPEFCHKWRTSSLNIRWKEVWIVWEIHPVISKRFDVNDRVWFFELNVSKIISAAYWVVKAKEISAFQENNFDVSFVVDKKIDWKDIKQSILNSDKKLIKKVELFDIYENEEKLPGQRSLSFKVFIQSMNETISDKTKSEIIDKIISKVEKKWGKLR